MPSSIGSSQANLLEQRPPRGRWGDQPGGSAVGGVSIGHGVRARYAPALARIQAYARVAARA